MAKIKLSPKEIAEREFKITLRGFDREEVDILLDDVINDYEVFTAQIQALRKENEDLRNRLKSSFSETQGYSSESFIDSQSATDQYSSIERVSATVTNFDILKRISRLEKEVFGKQIVE